MTAKSKPTPLVAGNWKMNGDVATYRSFLSGLAPYAQGASEVVICPPGPLLGTGEALGGIRLGGQDCHYSHFGAHTGDTSAALLVDLDCRYVILGHSERRSDHAERSDLVRDKAKAAIAAGLSAIVCIGETKDERESGRAVSVVLDQLKTSIPDDVTAKQLVVAYEPVWAIGTGLTAGAEDIGEMHSAIRKALCNIMSDGRLVRILYGGSVKATNAREIFSVRNVNGALVGGASLTVDSFAPIVEAMNDLQA